MSLRRCAPGFAQYEVLSAHNLEYLPRDAYGALQDPIAKVKRMLYRFMQSLSAPGLTADG